MKSSFMTGVLAAGLYALTSLVNPSNAVAQDKNHSSQDSSKKEMIYAKEDLTVTGKSLFLVSDYTSLNPSGNDSYNFNEKLTSDGDINYSVISPNDLKNILKNDPTDSVLEKRFESFYQKMNKNQKSLNSLEKALKDGILTSNELQEVEPGFYAVHAHNSNEGVIRFIGVNKDDLKKSEALNEISQYSVDRDSSAIDTLKMVDYVTSEDTSKTNAQTKYEVPKDSAVVEDSVIVDDLETEEKIVDKDSANNDIEKTSDEVNLNRRNDRGTRPRLGLEASFGLNDELAYGAFLDVPLSKRFVGEIYANHYALRGDLIHSENSTEITQRERQLIGPGTYKEREDRIDSNIEQKIIAEGGAGVTLRMGSRFGVPFRAGFGILESDENLEGRSTISFERNDELLGEESVITNTDNNSELEGALTLSLGAEYNFKNFSLGASVNRIKEKNSARINLSYKF